MLPSLKQDKSINIANKNHVKNLRGRVSLGCSTVLVVRLVLERQKIGQIGYLIALKNAILSSMFSISCTRTNLLFKDINNFTEVTC